MKADSALPRAGFLPCIFCATTLLLIPGALHAQDSAHPERIYTEKDLQTLQSIRTILLTGSVATWLNLPQPPYNVFVTVKMKLQNAGFLVVLDPNEDHDAVLTVRYEEIPSGQFQVLEQGTAIRFETWMTHRDLGKVFSEKLEARPDVVAIGGLYWGAIHNLEENPYFFYLGEFLKGLIQKQADAASVLEVMLRRPYQKEEMRHPLEDDPRMESVRRGARLRAIEEMARLNNADTRTVLWDLTERASMEERRAAVDQLGRIGDSSFVPKLSHIAQHDPDQAVQVAAETAIARIQGF